MNDPIALIDPPLTILCDLNSTRRQEMKKAPERSRARFRVVYNSDSKAHGLQFGAFIMRALRPFSVQGSVKSLDCVLLPRHPPYLPHRVAAGPARRVATRPGDDELSDQGVEARPEPLDAGDVDGDPACCRSGGIGPHFRASISFSAAVDIHPALRVRAASSRTANRAPDPQCISGLLRLQYRNQ